MIILEIAAVIRQKLNEIEQNENVRVLLAVESGSRAWGFASPDSDYDVRFIYVRPQGAYLRLEAQRDVIEWQLDETLDINGWDLQKALRLLYKSNPTLFEWNNSPVIYRTTPYWESIRGEIAGFFQSKPGLYHYLNMAKTNYREYLKGETVRLKKYFYVIRPILAARWILERHCPPPMLFTELAGHMLEPALRPVVAELMRRKMEEPELREGAAIPELNEYIARSMEELTAAVENVAPDRSADWEKLNAMFLAGLA